MRKLVWFTLGFAAACAVCAWFYCEYLVWFALGALVLCAAGFFCIRFHKAFRMVAAVFLGVGIGFAGFLLYDGIYLQPVRMLNGQTAQLEMVSDDYCVITDYGSSTEGTVRYKGISYRIRVYLNEETTLSPGDVLRGSFQLRFAADGGEGVSTQHRGKGIFLTAVQTGEVSVEPGAGFSVLHYPALWRKELKTRIDSSFPGDVSAMVKGLLLGDRTDLTYETETAFKVSGISHIVAVSGLHISILFSMLGVLTLRRRRLTAIIGIPALLLFAAVVGFTPSVTRACIMYILMLLSWLLMREYDPPTELAFAVLVMLIVNPLAVTSVSLQLSSACMIGIYMFSGKLRGWLLDQKRFGRFEGFPGKVLRWVVTSVSVTLGSMAFTTPLCAYYFGAVSLIGVITNLMTLPVVTLIFYGIVVVCLLGFVFPAAAVVVGWLFAWPVRYVLLLARVLSEVPFAAVYTQSRYVIWWLVFAYCAFGVFLLLKKKRPLLFVASVVGTLILAIVASCILPGLDSYRFTVLDVGNGQCILLQAEGRTFLVDCGGDYEEGAADDAAQLLLSQGISRIDGLILTHYDRDHAGGAGYFLSRIAADHIYAPYFDPMPEGANTITNGETEYIREKTVLRFGSSELTIFPGETTNSGNESSLCILLCTKKCDILITGDRGAVGERQLAKRYDLPDVDVLIAGHHGAEDSATQILLDEVRPEYAVISVGKNNRYGHPAQAVLDRLAARGCRILRTDQDGTILFRG